MIRRLRSALFLPASNARAVAKARTLPCDAVILDLEDAVGPDAKDDARAAAVEAAREGFGDRRVVLRINGLDTGWARDDLIAARDAPFDAILVPKVTSAADLHHVEQATACASSPPALWAMIETAAAIVDLPAIAATRADTRLSTLVLGTNDLAKDLRARPSPDRAELLPLLVPALAVGRAHRLVVLDGVYNRIDDAAGLAAECAQGSRIGFDGKSLIHPSQIATCNAAFGPTEAELDHARAIVAAFAAPEAAGRGALRLGDTMIERLHLEEAKRLLEQVDTIEH